MRIAVLIAASVLVAGCSQSVGGDAERPTPSLTAPPSTTRADAIDHVTAPRRRPPDRRARARRSPTSSHGSRRAARRSRRVSLRDPRRRHDTARRRRRIRHAVGQGQLHDRLEVQRRRAGMSGGADRTRRRDPTTPTESGRAAGSTSTASSSWSARVTWRSRPFAAGIGPELPYGQSLAFGDYRCRGDQAGLFCVNYAHQSAARFSDAGVQPFGCLQPVTRRCRRSVRCSAAERGVVGRIGVHDHRAELRNRYGPVHVRRRGRRCERRPGSVTDRRRVLHPLRVDDRPSAS